MIYLKDKDKCLPKMRAVCMVGAATMECSCTRCAIKNLVCCHCPLDMALKFEELGMICKEKIKNYVVDAL
jgi:hypothetical protein